MTFGSDGHCYKCSTTATPTAKQCRLGNITSDINEFKKMVSDNQQGDWDCDGMCFSNGLRGNRMAVEINAKAQELLTDRCE